MAEFLINDNDLKGLKGKAVIVTGTIFSGGLELVRLDEEMNPTF